MKNIDEYDEWENIQGAFDVFQLYELLVFKYGPIFKDTKEAIDEYEEDYNPDHFYEIIEMELKSNNIWNDFLENHEKYSNEKDEADPFHWKHRKKIHDDLIKRFDDFDDDIKF